MRISDWSSDVCSSDLLSDRLSRRDGMTEAWLIEEAARRGDLSTTLSHFDALFRTMPTASARFMQQMGLALGDPKFRKAMIPYARIESPWLDRKSTRLNSSH